MDDEYKGPDRRKGLSEEDVERIAELAAKKALAHVYGEVGKSVLNKLAWVVGAAVIAILMWLGQNHINLK